MNEKQIEETAKDLCPLYEKYKSCKTCDAVLGVGEEPCVYKCIAKLITAKDYRKQEWISVEERLPENDYEKHWKERQRFLVYTEPNGLMYVAKYGYKEYGWWSDGGGYVLDEKNYRKVTHWMPLPQPPKGE